MWCIDREEREENQNESGYQLESMDDVLKTMRGMIKAGNEQIIKDKIEDGEQKTKSYNIGNSDYSRYNFQVLDIIDTYNLNFREGSALKYLLRKKDNRLEDLKKARHYIEMLIEIEEVENGENV